MIRGLLFFLIGMIALSSCKTEFEQIRTSGDAAKMLTKANEYYEAGEYGRAIVLYDLIISAYRGRKEAEDIGYKYAMSHFKDGSYVLSSHHFKSFADAYTSSAYREEALFLSAFSEYKMSPRFKLEQSSTKNAIDAFQTFVNTYPDSDRVPDANKYMDELRAKQERKAYESGKLYYQLGNYNSAIQSLDNMMRDFPGSPLTEDALYLATKASYDWAANSVYARQKDRFAETLDRCKLFIKKYPRSKFIDKIKDYKKDCEMSVKNVANG